MGRASRPPTVRPPERKAGETPAPPEKPQNDPPQFRTFTFRRPRPGQSYGTSGHCRKELLWWLPPLTASPGNHRPGAGTGPDRGTGPGGTGPDLPGPSGLWSGDGRLSSGTLPGGGHPRGADRRQRRGLPGAAAGGARSLRRSPASGGGGPPVPPRGAFRPGGKISSRPRSWSSTWAAAAPNSPWCGRGKSPDSPACPWGSSP